MNSPAAPGEEFRDDLRLRPPEARATRTEARRVLTSAELAELTALNDWRSLAALLKTVVVVSGALALGVLTWPSAWVLVAIVVIGIEQHAMFILAHDAAHYRLFRSRVLNDVVGRALGMAGGISMCTYRVIHRLHHNNLYTEED